MAAGDGIDWFEGFETDQGMTVWEDITLGGWPMSRSPSWARSGGYGMRPSGSLGIGGGQGPILVPAAERIVGFAFKPVGFATGSLPGAAHILAMVRAPGVVVARLEFTEQKTLGVEFPQGVGINGYLNRSLEMDAWYYIEWYVKLHGSAGETIVRVNGDVEFASSGINTGTPAFGGINQLYIGRMDGGNSSSDFYYDDIYTLDASVRGFLGDVEVVGVELEDDFAIQWERNSLTKNYLTVIENTPDEDVTFVATPQDDPGPVKDLYVVGDSTYQGTIYAVQLVSRGRKTSTHLWHIRNTIQVGGVDAYGPDIAMSYPLYETYRPTVFGHQPNGADWDLASFNAMVVGFEAEAFTNDPGP